MQGRCPLTPLPGPFPPNFVDCLGSFVNDQLTDTLAFNRCVFSSGNTACEETSLADPSGFRIVPDRCIDFTTDRDAPSFECPSGAVDTQPRFIYCSETFRTAQCRSPFCAAQPGDDVVVVRPICAAVCTAAAPCPHPWSCTRSESCHTQTLPIHMVRTV